MRTINEHREDRRRVEIDVRAETLLAFHRFLERLADRHPLRFADTLAVVAEAGFAAAFTTEQEAVSNRSSAYRLGRFQVPNSAGPQFAQLLRQWQQQS